MHTLTTAKLPWSCCTSRWTYSLAASCHVPSLLIRWLEYDFTLKPKDMPAYSNISTCASHRHTHSTDTFHLRSCSILRCFADHAERCHTDRYMFQVQ